MIWNIKKKSYLIIYWKITTFFNLLINLQHYYSKYFLTCLEWSIFLAIFVTSGSTKILITSNFWLRVYVYNVNNKKNILTKWQSAICGHTNECYFGRCTYKSSDAPSSHTQTSFGKKTWWSIFPTETAVLFIPNTQYMYYFSHLNKFIYVRSNFKEPCVNTKPRSSVRSLSHQPGW